MLFFLFPETYPIQVLWLIYHHFLSCWHPQSCWLISLIVSLFQFYKYPDLILLLSIVTSQPSFSPPPGALASNLPRHSGQRLSWNPVIIPPCPEKQNHLFFLWMEAAVSCSEIPQAIPQKTILFTCQINNRKHWFPYFEKRIELGYNILQHLCLGKMKGWTITQTPTCWAYLLPPARILNHHPINHWQHRLHPQSLAFSMWLPADDSPSSLCPWVTFTAFRLYIFWPFSLCHKFLGSSEGLGKLSSASPIRVSTSWNKRGTWKLPGFVSLTFLVSCIAGLPLAAISSP